MIIKILEPLDAEMVAGAIGQEARHQQARQAASRLRQHQEGVAHRRGKEELVPDQFIGFARPANPDGRGAGGVGAHVGAALTPVT